MDKDVLFRLYYVAWKQKNNIEKFEEFKGLQNDIESYKEVLLEGDTKCLLKYFPKTIYLDIWLDIFTNGNRIFFYDISLKYKDELISNIIETLYYISKTTLKDYLEYDKEDFSPVFDEDNENIIKYNVNLNKIMKNLLLIIKKTDIDLYNEIEDEVEIKLEKRKANIQVIKNLWNSLKIDENGKVSFEDDVLEQLQKIMTEYPDIINDFSEEVRDFLLLVDLYK